jgi:hypothetical protein
MFNRKKYMKKYLKKYYQEHKEQRKDYRQKHREEIREWDRNFYQTHKEKRLIESKKYNKIHVREIKEYKVIWYKKNKERLTEKAKKYYQEHKEEVNQYYKNRRKIDINFRIKHYLRTRITKALDGICKSKITTKLLDCSIEQLRKHLESQFKLGMTWDNYGKWHIDHVRPCAFFDLSKPNEQKKCFNYKNLQPLWAKDNLEKSNKIV